MGLAPPEFTVQLTEHRCTVGVPDGTNARWFLVFLPSTVARLSESQALDKRINEGG